ncbi:hypothetical protein AYM40_37245 (plasmid) [Paraburkholderia phytofirmans OLGA172]|uniref:Uncharacterized protein n=1 Tax=Paraburkholderia phytofirmans OLGA172 TaxID=1417228 RepID=A0A167WPT2_9BURK|nr:hypothetical protein [Paraburkholderia phytofirmans]ANB78012.1 hypothetical protein AYM40_37245 [Paraburkholderia phytofirmans OLGA172]
MKRSRFVASICVAIAALGASAAHAQPVELDTDAAHIIVVRPIDMWSGDTSTLDATLAAVRERKVSYDVKLDGTRYRGSPLVLQGVSDNPVTLGVESALKERDTNLVRNGAYLFHVLDYTALAPADYPLFAKAQVEYYTQFVLRQGDPRTLPGSVRVRNFVGNVLSVGALFIPAHALGAGMGAQVMANSGLAEDIGNIPRPARSVLTPSALPALDPSVYKEIDVRRVEFKPDAPGEIIIAYKADKTPQAEQDALIKAIVSVTGADTTPEAVEQSRQRDFEKRVAIWDACVADGKCQKEASNDPK